MASFCTHKLMLGTYKEKICGDLMRHGNDLPQHNYSLAEAVIGCMAGSALGGASDLKKSVRKFIMIVCVQKGELLCQRIGYAPNIS